MKLLYSHRTKSADGQRVHIDGLTRALTARGVALEICGPRQDENANGALAAGLSERARFKLPGAIYEGAEFGYSAVGYRRLRRAAAAFAPDVLYERYNLFYHAGARLARSRGLPFILEVNAPLAEERGKTGGLTLKAFAQWSETSLWRAADRVLPVTGVLASMIEAAGVRAQKIDVVPNGVEDAFLQPQNGDAVRARYGVPLEATVLGFAGFVRDWHRVDRALAFLASDQGRSAWLLLVGDGPAREALERAARTAGVADRFVVTGVVQRAEMPAHAAAFDIALQPAATAYASPLKLFEYMALGKAIIAPDAPNIREALAADEAILTPIDDDAAFAAALSRLVADADLRARLGAAARAALLRGRFTWAHNAERVERIAQALIDQRSKTRTLS
ncbi:MAG: glycosyltransferase [Pseudomonadota bacterium]